MTRDELERTIHRLGGWYADQRVIDELMRAVDAYAASLRDAGEPAPEERGAAVPDEEPQSQPAAVLPLPVQAPTLDASVKDVMGWLLLGVPMTGACPQVTVSLPAESVPTGDENGGGGRELRCRDCGLVTDDVSRFRRRNDRGPGVYRSYCRKCENRRESTRRKAKVSGK